MTDHLKALGFDIADTSNEAGLGERRVYFRIRNREPGRRAQIRASAKRARAKLRPFVAVDSEGGSVGAPIAADLPVRGSHMREFQPHKTFLWGAGDKDGATDWLFHGRPLGSVEICDWLLSLPKLFGPSIFISFAFGYDVAQIIAELPFEKAWELQRNATPDQPKRKLGSRHVVFWGEYGFQFLKGKSFKLFRLPKGNPFIKVRRLDKASGEWREERRLKPCPSIMIYDVFGFFQSSFLNALKTFPGAISPDDYAIVEAGKAERGNFKIEDIETIRRYTSKELSSLATMMHLLREALHAENIKMKSWFGAGSIASALMKREATNQHLAPLKTGELEKAQEYAHHAYFGGRIELVKQGKTNAKLYVYDIASAYPAAATLLPGMAGGRWTSRAHPTLADIAVSSRLSMVRLQGSFAPDCPFYPFPYRTPKGSILFPPRVNGIYMRDEVMIAHEFINMFGGSLEMSELHAFEPSGEEATPFAFIQQLFDYRASLPKTDVREKVIKLGINSVYGKLAQRIGERGIAPVFASPWHAAAITAWTRSQLLKAAMLDPDAIVMLATDGIISTRPLPLAIPATKTLGSWEAGIAPEGGVFIHSGVYSISSGKGGWITKSRGFRPANSDRPIGEVLRDVIPRLWKEGAKLYPFEYHSYMTLGASTASSEAWSHVGQWVRGTRELKLASAGAKRTIPPHEKDRRKRGSGLVDTLPNDGIFYQDVDADGDAMLLSAPSAPEWLDDDYGWSVSAELEQDDIEAGFS